jgi:ATP-dependent Clp protease ATP-binding subunit ClpA
LTLTEAGRDLLADLGYDPDMGARPLRRVIQSNIEDRLSDGLLSGEFKDGDQILVDAEEGAVRLRPVRESVGEPELAAG